MHSLWQLYSETQFIAKEELPMWPEFAVITAHNPLGKELSQVENDILNERFREVLHELGLAHSSVDGVAPDLSYSEAGWMILCSQVDALKLAKQFEQNAFYYIKNDELWLVPALLEGECSQLVGQWSKRFRERCF